MGPDRESTPARPTRRELREAERRAQASSAVLTPPGVPVAPASRRSVPAEPPAVPSWTRTAPAVASSVPPAPGPRTGLPVPGSVTSGPSSRPRATTPAPAGLGTLPAPGSVGGPPAPRTVSTPGPRTVSSPAARTVGAPGPRTVSTSGPRTADAPAPRTADALRPTAPGTSAPRPVEPAAPRTTLPAPGPLAGRPAEASAPASPAPVAPAPSSSWPSWSSGTAAPAAAPVGQPASLGAAGTPAVAETSVMAPLTFEDDEPAAERLVAASAVDAEPPVRTDRDRSGERATRSARGASAATRPAGRGMSRMPRAAVRLGVLGALAGVTVVIPTVSQGALDGVGLPGSDAALAESTLPDTVTALTAGSLSILPPSSLVSADGALAARQAAAGAASRSEERSALANCDGTTRPSGENGLLKTSDLCTLWDGHTQLRADAAVSLAEFNQAFVARFGADLCLSSGYRSLAQQRAVKAQKGGLAAAPGKSNHGWGLAIDLCQNQTSGTKWAWITENGPAFGWENPAWAKRGGSGPYEPWHWEYAKGVQEDGEYYG
ncbi:D-alanyl-D-alanine carboxypeptidase family protein [Cellulomonas fimi]|uniref:Peptidase M15B and M15C DD-carboxypeptidase VanY/endolysin n=1 Tax=Cellulomonas fimi (strain ATCC 484 / DSM 20113 / JCM 1341 / CCUG 24087 / LMG 16345 / NBRC 15513 / NCIMB 8980 / NCTC 7547 / NRS-133) TaxID=590998 RepID=F4H642_CELFA|nr:D-alanyl-D-alanine carboxypeptidase family protein [Cellulomonas fimi]AEE46772.1 peptidase M15B and M15C DD-carboxypeptidase VanY/endolysin [Cellulomonas fimi ATCC 484]VEH34139.1 D-alanyl-D-alanine carboxypeptidase [Cellulomonas fimi]